MSSPLAAPGAEPAQPIDGGVEFSGKRVLLLDDDPVLSRAWGRTLSQHGMLVVTCGRIHEARSEIEGLRARNRRLHYALIDDRLPDGFGLDLIGALDELRPAPSFAVVSAHPSTERALRAWQRELVIVPKPVSPNGLLQLMGFLATRDGRKGKRRERPPRAPLTEALKFGAYMLTQDGLLTPEGAIHLSATAIELLALLVERDGRWMSTPDLCRSLYGREDAHAANVVRRHISLLRRTLGTHSFLVESALQRGYRIAPSALSPRL
jgi:DNA-binding response OmpR family regulator